MVLIPEEAECLIPMFQRSTSRWVHLLTYAAPVTKKMLHFNHLSYYSMPPLRVGWKPPKWLIIELGILAGRVYFDFGEYQSLREYLGISDFAYDPDDVLEDPMTSASPTISGLGEHVTEVPVSDSLRRVHSFAARPLIFLQDWLSIRRRGQEFTHAPMGYVCSGRPLNEAHSFFSKVEHDTAHKPRIVLTAKEQSMAQQTLAESDDDLDWGMENEEGYFDGSAESDGNFSNEEDV